jgi:type II secretory pathway component PulF
MVKTGEMTGNVDLMLNKMAEYYEDEGSLKARQSAMILGVLVFLAVAAYVGFVIITFYTGMYGGIGAAAGG